MEVSLDLFSKINEKDKLKEEVEYIKKLVSIGIPIEKEIGQSEEK